MSTGPEEGGVSFMQMALVFGRIIQSETNNVYTMAKSVLKGTNAGSGASVGTSNMNSYNVEMLSAMTNQLNVITTALMNCEKTYKACFDSINRTVQ